MTDHHVVSVGERMKRWFLLGCVGCLLGLTPVDLNGPKQYRPLGVWCYPSAGCVDENNHPSSFPPNAGWVLLDISERIPLTAKIVALNGMLIITNPTGLICDIEVWFRTPGSGLRPCADTGGVTPCARLIWQAVDEFGGGQRSNGYALVPVKDATVEVLWRTIGWPWSGCSVGLNVGVDAWE